MVENDGNLPLDLTAITPDANAAVDPGDHDLQPVNRLGRRIPIAPSA